MTVYRIVKRKHGANAFDGEGARLYPGRWNFAGIKMIYTAQSRSLAALEYFVHIGEERKHIEFVYFTIEVPDDLKIEKISMAQLPEDWNMQPPNDSTRIIGTEWVKSTSSPVLQVPTVIVPDEYNFLLNPNHPDFNRINIEKPEPFQFDSRMWK
ncbi:MAG: RES family NAD+ phosphorylase [Deltaproteobacteria bacterium]|nr:RES family NAD+ phosphorylase [Deltaproteobacteria bacterium]